MSTRSLFRGLAAAVLATPLLVLSPGPASASVTHVGVITAGTFSFDTKGPDFVIDLGEPDPGTPCPEDPADQIVVTTDFYADRTTKVTGLSASLASKIHREYQHNGQWYQLSLELGGAAAMNAGVTSGPSSPYPYAQNYRIRASVETLDPNTCAKVNTICEIEWTLVTTGTLTPTPPNTSPHPPATAVTSGSGTIQRGVPCVAPASGWFAPTPPPAPSVTATGLTIVYS